MHKIIENVKRNEQPLVEECEVNQKTTQEIILEAELELANRKLEDFEAKTEYKTKRYNIAELSDDGHITYYICLARSYRHLTIPRFTD